MAAGGRCIVDRAAEKKTGSINSIVGGASAVAVMFFLNLAGVDVSNATWIVNIVVSLMAYILDILFAKQCFESGGKSVSLQLSDRAKWLFHSFFTYTFARVIVLMALDIFVTQSIVNILRRSLDKQGVFTRYRKHRDYVVALLVSLLTFTFYVNYLQFQWAYRERSILVEDVVMLMWCFVGMVSMFVTSPEDRRA